MNQKSTQREATTLQVTTAEQRRATIDAEPQIKALKSIAELEQIRLLWESLPGNRDSEMDTYLALLNSTPETVRPHVLVAYRDGTPDAILVGRLDLGHVSCRLGYLRLNVPAKVLCFVYGALRGNPSPENQNLMASSILASLSNREADVAYLNFLRDDSDLLKAGIQMPNLLCRDYIRVTQPHFATILASSVDAFYQSLSSGARWQAKNKQKRLLKNFTGEVAFRCFREVGELDKLRTDMEEVAKKSYQRVLGVGFIDTPRVRRQFQLKAERGWLRAYVLYLKGQPVAFWVGDLNAGTFGSDYLAYDAEYSKHSPGMCLVYKVIEGFCEDKAEGVRAIDFAPGHAQYKQILSNQSWRETSVYIFAPSLKGLSINIVRSVTEGSAQALKKVLEYTNLLPAIKKAWRAHARSEAARSEAAS